MEEQQGQRNEGREGAAAAGGVHSVKLGERSFELEVRDCRVCLGGEFAGNVELALGCEASLGEPLSEHLGLRVPGAPEPLELLGWGSENGRLGVALHSEWLSTQTEAPERVTLLWDDAEVADLPCRRWGCVPLDQARLQDPASILGAEAMRPPAGAIVVGGWRGPVLSGTGLALLALAAVAGSSPLWKPELFGGGALVGGVLAGLGALLLALMWVPYEQVRLEPVARRVSRLQGRFVFSRFHVHREAHMGASDLSHVRVVERWQGGGSDERDESVWQISLEGPIAWMGAAGDVHLRADAIPVGTRGSRQGALYFAARMAHALGLRVLDTTDTGM